MLAETLPATVMHHRCHEGNPSHRKPGAGATGPAVRWAELSVPPPGPRPILDHTEARRHGEEASCCKETPWSTKPSPLSNCPTSVSPCLCVIISVGGKIYRTQRPPPSSLVQRDESQKARSGSDWTGGTLGRAFRAAAGLGAVKVSSPGEDTPNAPRAFTAPEPRPTRRITGSQERERLDRRYVGQSFPCLCVIISPGGKFC